MGEDVDADVAEVPGRVLMADGGGRCPQDELGRPRNLFRAGDVLRVSCPPRQAEVPRATEFHVYVRWPWRWLRDSQSDWSEAAGFNLDWKGLLGFDRDRDHPDAGWLFRFDPGLPVLQAGDRCRVGIPATVVHVFDVSSWYLGLVQTSEPPASLVVLVLPRGVPHDLGRDDLVDALRPYEREPTRVELLFRPYPHLRDLDVVTDRHGRRWAFCAPWWWVELDHDDATAGLPVPLAGPAWPLTLLAGVGGDAPHPERAARVAGSTAEGDHASHLAAWSRLAAATPLGLEHQGLPGPDPHEPVDDPDRERADTRAAIAGMTFTQILGVLLHTWARHHQLGAHDDEPEAIAVRRRLQWRAAELASVLRELRTGRSSVFRG
jgi:hypothetical protein